MPVLAAAILAVIIQPAASARTIDYAALYSQGVTFTAFLDGARARAVDWRRNYAEAAIADAALARVRGLPARRLLLIVAEPSCSDSLATIPYLAKLADAAPERLELRIINGRAGRSVMEAHRTPDDRAATPTVVVLSEEGRFIGAWSERPAALQKWYIEQKDALSRDELFNGKSKWYADDAGKSAVQEIVDLLAGQG